MPAPYSLIEIPQGNPNDIFEAQGMNMALIHNTFIRGMNAIAAQAPYVAESQVKPFLFFCTALTALIHHHHHNEETFFFPEIEKHLGIHSMDPNVNQHKTFLPHLDEFEERIKAMQEESEPYDGALIVARLNGFCDPLMEHLHDEIKTLEPSRLRQHITKEELTRIDKNFSKKAVEGAKIDRDIPLFLVTHDWDSTPWFNHLPTPLVWAVKYWFSRRHKDAWEFGPCDMSSKPKTELKAHPPVVAIKA